MAANDLTHTNSAATTLSINDGATYTLLAGGLRGVYARPGENVTEEVHTRRLRHVLVTTRPLARRITIPLKVYGATRAVMAANLSALKRHFFVDARAGAYGTLTYEDEAANVRAWTVFPVTDTIDDALRWLAYAASAPSVITVEVVVECLDHACYNPTVVTVGPTVLNGIVPVNFACNNLGDEDAYIAEMTIGGPATDVSINDARGVWLAFAATVAAGQTLTVKLRPHDFAITHSVDGSWLGQRATGSDIPMIPPGNNDLVVAGGAGDDGPVTVKFFSTYSGL